MNNKKNELRKYYKNLRQSLTSDTVSEKSNIICGLFTESDLYKNAETVMLYSPIRNETDTRTIIKKAFEDGKRVVLPVTCGDDIYGVYLTAGSVMAKGRFDVPEPQNAEKADKMDIDIAAVPGIAFDRKGGRIGFGKGYYDRFLKDIRAVKIALCYDFQIADSIDTETFDIKMEYIITESGVIKC